MNERESERDTSGPQAVVEDALEIAFGDGDRDPQPTIDALRRDAAARDAVRAHIGTLRAVSHRGDEQVGLERLEAVLMEAEAPMTHATLPDTASSNTVSSNTVSSNTASSARDNVVPLFGGGRAAAHFDGRGGSQGASSMRGARPAARRPWLMPALGFAIAASTAFVVWPRGAAPGTTTPDPGASVALADVRGDVSRDEVARLARDVESVGLSFAGPTAPTPAASGYLLAAALDVEASASLRGDDGARAVALGYAEQVTSDRVPPVPAEKALRGGCPALFPSKADVALCEHGAFAYRMRRDLGAAAGDRRARTPAAAAFVVWAASSAPSALSAPLETLKAATLGALAVEQSERDAWKAVLEGVRALLAG